MEFARIIKKNSSLIIPILIGIAIWFLPKPEALTLQAWHTFAIFVATIVAIVLKPFPIGAIAIISLSITTITGTLTMGQALESYSNDLIWLILIAFFISRAFMKTQLGTRIAYHLVNLFGKNSLGLSYSFIMSEFLLAPAIPSVTARTGGIVYPIATSLSTALESKPNHSSAKKLGSFLTLVCFQGSVITSAMFLTAMAANPIVARLAGDAGINLTWTTWAIAGIVPGIISLILVPFIIYKISPPEIKHLPDAKEFAKTKLAEMGSMKRQEWIMLFVFVLLLVLWILGNTLNINATATAFLGVLVLLVTGVLNFNDLLEEKSGWETFIWFGALLTLAAYLNRFGVISYLSEHMSSIVQTMTWPVALVILSLIYFYMHYIFASSMAHVTAMYSAFLSIAIILGAPPYLAALILAFFSNLFGGITHYGIGSAPVLFGVGYVNLREWWRVGLIISFVNILIWFFIGGFWWKILGYWN
ncbi:MAG: anion permease [Verrucomicrobia bacterium]|nr:MAG: anion permease [Verrucomicrobiota bacterium]